METEACGSASCTNLGKDGINGLAGVGRGVGSIVYTSVVFACSSYPVYEDEEGDGI